MLSYVFFTEWQLNKRKESVTIKIAVFCLSERKTFPVRMRETGFTVFTGSERKAMVQI